jgi:hypothetical protein
MLRVRVERRVCPLCRCWRLKRSPRLRRFRVREVMHVRFDLAPSRFFALFFMDPELVPHVIDLAKVAL